MSISAALNKYKTDVAQCESLIVSAHQATINGNQLIALDQEQITNCAFLNFFIAWESFLEETLSQFLIGAPAINGNLPIRFVQPQSFDHAKNIVIAPQRFFDYANHDNFRKIANLYFNNGYPYEPHISSVFQELNDLKTIRNRCAHMSSTTQTALDALVLRIMGRPLLGVSVYRLLMSPDPRVGGAVTVFRYYRDKLDVAAELIANG